ncbi:hypothetical protein AAFP30_15845 [Gordonia sp. CPCC 205515]|uniref:hypothetical protein n=1 Tax=Gordonia sp. CPCC 205515 TaxID=3140791 RepID=UPI003AF3CD5C
MSGNVVHLFDETRARRLNGLLVVRSAANGCLPTVIGVYVDGDVVPMNQAQTIPELTQQEAEFVSVDLVDQPGYRLSVWQVSLEMSA